MKERLADLDKKRFTETLNVFKFIGDSITSTQLMGVPKRYFGFEFNDGAVGLGGLTSSLITCYNIYPEAKKK